MISPNTYEEVYEILSYMDKITVMKIPDELLSNINKKRNSKFKTKIDKNDLFNKENISNEAMDLLCYIDYNYWMTKESKSQVDKIKAMNELNIEKQKIEKYNPDNLFEKFNKNVKTNLTEEVALKEYNKSLFKKILNKIISIFKK